MIKDEMWSDEWFYELDPSEKLMWVFLLTNPRNNIAGIYKVNNKWIGNHTGFEKNVVELILERFIRDKKIKIQDNWIIIINHYKHQSTNPKVETGILRIISELPLEIRDLIDYDSLYIAYPTLLNSTLLNSTQPKGEKTPTKKSEINFIKLVEDCLLDFKNTIPDSILKVEVQKFLLYWTEKNPNGKKEKWEMQSTFDVKRRLASWLKNTEKWDKQKLSNKPQIIL